MRRVRERGRNIVLVKAIFSSDKLLRPCVLYAFENNQVGHAARVHRINNVISNYPRYTYYIIIEDKKKKLIIINHRGRALKSNDVKDTCVCVCLLLWKILIRARPPCVQ